MRGKASRGQLASAVMWLIAICWCIPVRPAAAAVRNPVPAYCSKLLSQMATALEEFDYCALNNSRPFTVCLGCALSYRRAFDLFGHFINGTSELSANCSMLIDGGKVSLVSESFQHIEKVWSVDGVCEDCYTPGSQDVSPNVQEFFARRDSLQSCLDRYPPTEENRTCVECEPQFRNLSTFFSRELHSKMDSGHCLCVDVLDAMNETRHEWGNMCFSAPHGMTPDVLVAMFTSFGATILFYLIVRVSQKPKDIELARVSTWQSIKLEAECSETDQVDAVEQAAQSNSHQTNLRRQVEHFAGLTEAAPRHSINGY